MQVSGRYLSAPARVPHEANTYGCVLLRAAGFHGVRVKCPTCSGGPGYDVVSRFLFVFRACDRYALRDKRGLDEVTGKSASNVGKQKREPEDDDTSAVQDALRFASMVGFRFAETLERNLVIALYVPTHQLLRSGAVLTR